MCEYGETIMTRVFIPARLSYTGEDRWDMKPIDSCIQPIVQALNDHQIITINSCCGHGKFEGSILLLDGREITIRRN